MQIGYVSGTYLEQRCFLDALKNVKYVDLNKVPGLTPFVDTKKVFTRNPPCQCVFIDSFAPDGIVHLFNYINMGSAPYVTTFETTAPRFFNYKDTENAKRVYESLASDKCRALLAMSQDALDKEIDLLEQVFPEEIYEKLYPKFRVLQPPQAVLSDAPPPVKEKINFLFVGRDFFRKGGHEMLLAFRDLAKERNDFHLHIVSSLRIVNAWNVSETTPEEVEWTINFVKDCQFITHYESLPNNEVLNLCQQCNVGLLPTYQETYGLSVLEMQASGLPVVTTNIRALPEMNNADCGWLIGLDRKEELRCEKDSEKVARAKKAVVRQLKGIVNDILDHPDQIRNKGMNAITRIRFFHDPAIYKHRLLNYYMV